MLVAAALWLSCAGERDGQIRSDLPKLSTVGDGQTLKDFGATTFDSTADGVPISTDTLKPDTLKPDSPCSAACAGKLCGAADGCGGNCLPGSGCCAPKCQGKACGSSDGCNGTCAQGSGCCTASCSGKTFHTRPRCR